MGTGKDGFYDCMQLLNKLDINGNKPEIYISTGLRSGGKTTSFNHYVVERFLKYGEKFMLLFRYSYELTNCENNFFKNIQQIYYPQYEMFSESLCKGKFKLLTLKNTDKDTDEKSKGEPCGYAVSLNSVDAIKKNSHFFSDTQCMLFDEFMPESGHYLSNEIDDFISVHWSVSRGVGEAVRYVPVYMLANTHDILNPYFANFGIGSNLKKDTKFLKGNGWVLEQYSNEEISNKQKTSSFNTAFGKSDYIGYGTENIYLDNNRAFIESPKGEGNYQATIKYENNYYAIIMYPDSGYMYCTDKADMTFPVKYSITTEDHDINFVLLEAQAFYFQAWKKMFTRGAFRFKNLKCKQVIMTMLSYV